MKKLLGLLLLSFLLMATMATAVLPSGTVHVYVKETNGKPAAGAMITVYSDMNGAFITQVTADSNGEKYIHISSPYVGNSVHIKAGKNLVYNGDSHIQVLPKKIVTTTIKLKFNPSG